MRKDDFVCLLNLVKSAISVVDRSFLKYTVDADDLQIITYIVKLFERKGFKYYDVASNYVEVANSKFMKSKLGCISTNLVVRIRIDKESIKISVDPFHPSILLISVSNYGRSVAMRVLSLAYYYGLYELFKESFNIDLSTTISLDTAVREIAFRLMILEKMRDIVEFLDHLDVSLQEIIEEIEHIKIEKYDKDSADDFMKELLEMKDLITVTQRGESKWRNG